jgi:ATP-dependent DNA ligase
LKNRHKQFILDGEAVVLGDDGISDFNALHSGKLNHDVQLYAFNVIAMDGDDLRALPLSIRKAILERLLHRRPDGIFTGSFEQGETISTSAPSEAVTRPPGPSGTSRRRARSECRSISPRIKL